MTYRELAVAPALQGHVRAFFSFVPGGAQWVGRRLATRELHFKHGDSFCSPQFADGHASLVVDLGAACTLGGGWTFGAKAKARAIGALTKVGACEGDMRSAMVGAYLEPGATAALLQAPAGALTDRVVDLDLLWGAGAVHLAEALASLDERRRVDHLEAALIARLAHAPRSAASFDVVQLARWAWVNPTTMTVQRLAETAGISRQHLTRVFREAIGISPKRYCRLARFHAGLGYARDSAHLRWAEVAAELGYADQSHMIAEFRAFSSLTPEAMAGGRWFHPFILRARSRVQGPARARLF